MALTRDIVSSGVVSGDAMRDNQSGENSEIGKPLVDES